VGHGGPSRLVYEVQDADPDYSSTDSSPANQADSRRRSNTRQLDRMQKILVVVPVSFDESILRMLASRSGIFSSRYGMSKTGAETCSDRARWYGHIRSQTLACVNVLNSVSSCLALFAIAQLHRPGTLGDVRGELRRRYGLPATDTAALLGSLL